MANVEMGLEERAGSRGVKVTVVAERSVRFTGRPSLWSGMEWGALGHIGT